jgi:hypothetical protein
MARLQYSIVIPLALCGAGEHYSVTFNRCHDCPANSMGEYPGLFVCPCAVGYYRADGEEDLPCTRELLQHGETLTLTILSNYHV